MGPLILNILKGVCIVVVATPLVIMFLPIVLGAAVYLGLFFLCFFVAKKLDPSADTDWLFNVFGIIYLVGPFIVGILLLG